MSVTLENAQSSLPIECVCVCVCVCARARVWSVPYRGSCFSVIPLMVFNFD